MAFQGQRAGIGCASLASALPLVHLSEPGLPLVAGWPRAKAWIGDAGGEPLARWRGRGFTGCGVVNQRVSCSCGSQLRWPWEQEFPGPGLGPKCDCLAALRGTGPGGGPPRGAQQEAEGGPGADPGPVPVALPRCGTSAARPRHLLLPQQEGGRGAGAVGRSDLTLGHPGVSCEGERTQQTAGPMCLVPEGAWRWVTFLQKMKGALLSS